MHILILYLTLVSDLGLVCIKGGRLGKLEVFGDVGVVWG